ncbi:hypothetical protein VSX61_19685 [Brenneria populi subsp. brevivirga]|uniref:hypothetical protein n=1 Tax=Brenneria populi TaxID=1505588 RepID=UPI002E182F0A|nr:hypothetical protein [Brenneria populi subsp. brevivirga]
MTSKFFLFSLVMIFSCSFNARAEPSKDGIETISINAARFWLIGCNSAQVAIDRINRGEDKDKSLTDEYNKMKNSIDDALVNNNSSEEAKYFAEGVSRKYSFDGYKFKVYNQNKNCIASSKVVEGRVTMALNGDKEAQDALKGSDYAK